MKKLLTLILGILGLHTACSQKIYKNVDVAEFENLIVENNVIILDVRTAEEFSQGHIGGAINIDVNAPDFLKHVSSKFDPNIIIAVYCKSGRRSVKAAEILAAADYNVVNLKEGFEAWKNSKKSIDVTNYEVDRIRTKHGKTIEFHALMHASIRIVYDGIEIEIDPVAKLANRTVDYEKIPKAQYILVTHEHPDHFDKNAIKALSTDSSLIITNQRCAEMLGYGEIMHNGDEITLTDDISVKTTPAYNTTPDRPQFHPYDRDNGYILTIDGVNIYIAGDTEDIPEMNDLPDIDIAFLPCNQPYTMTPEQVINAARMVKPKVLFPYHYGQTDISKLPKLLKTEGIEVRIRHYE